MCISKKNPYEALPDQKDLCVQPGTVCGYVEKKCGRKFEKRLAVLYGRLLVVYKYYLFGICAGEPLLGQTYNLMGAESIRIEERNSQTFVNLCLRLTGKSANAWAVALISNIGGPLGHTTHNQTFGVGAQENEQNKDFKAYHSEKKKSSEEKKSEEMTGQKVQTLRANKDANNSKSQKGGDKLPKSDEKLKPEKTGTKEKEKTPESDKPGTKPRVEAKEKTPESDNAKPLAKTSTTQTNQQESSSDKTTDRKT